MPAEPRIDPIPRRELGALGVTALDPPASIDRSNRFRSYICSVDVEGCSVGEVQDCTSFPKTHKLLLQPRQPKKRGKVSKSV